MLKRAIPFLFLSITGFYPLLSQNGEKLLQEGKYEAARTAFEASLEQEEAPVTVLVGLARLYSDEAYSAYNPDTAFVYLREAQGHIRSLSKGQQRRLEKEGLDNALLRQLKAEIREKGLNYALAKGHSHSLLHYMEHYQRLSYELEKEAMRAFLLSRLQEVKQAGKYQPLKDFALAYEGEIKEYQPEMQPEIQRALFQAFFGARDSSNLMDLYAFLADFPDAAAYIDGPLSQALQEKPLITQAENYIRQANHRQMPQTIRLIYYYHYITGEWGDLLGFQNRYPFYADSFNIQAALTIARSAPDLKLGFTDGRLAAYQRYIELAAPTHKAFRALQQLIARDLGQKNWEAAIATLEQYAPLFKDGPEKVEPLIEVLRRPEEGITASSVGDAVNSTDGEYTPVLSADGQRLFFCRYTDGSEDIYFSEWKENAWEEARAITELNTSGSHEAPLAISADGTTLLMYDGGVVKYTDKLQEGWSPPRSFFSEEHTPEWQGSTTFASNREAVIFAARNLDVIGARNADNIDLFVSLRQPDGSWGAPVNLGKTINTPFEDRSPFLHPDMRTLYFSSAGHSGLGNLDVYVTRRIGDGWAEWPEPVNLGKEANLPGRDWGYKISTDGSTAYFSANAPGKREEIYQMPVPEAYRPEPVTAISGTLSGLDGHPLSAEIVLEDLSTGEPAGTVKPDPETGAFFITLPAGKLYSYTVRGEGLYPQSNNIDLREGSTGATIREDIAVPTVAEIRQGDITLPLKNLFFETGKHAIRPESFPELNRLAELIKTYSLSVEIAGHTDNVGSAEYNRRLSQNRAQAARNYLIGQEVAPEAISAAGYGFQQPVADNESEEGRALNRRVEIRFLRNEGMRD